MKTSWLIIALQLFSVCNAKAAEPVLSSSHLFGALVESNFQYWKEKNESELASAIQRASITDKKDQNELTEQARGAGDLGEKVLRQLISNSPNDAVVARARIDLARRVARKNNRKREALSILESGFVDLRIRDPLAASELLLNAGEVAAESGEIKAAIEKFKNVLTLRKEAVGSVLVTRAQIDLADVYFKDLRFDDALTYYTEALKNIGAAKGAEVRQQEDMLAPLTARLTWSAFRNSNYRLAVQWAQEFCRLKEGYKTALSEAVLQEVIRVASISLYEVNDVTLFDELSTDVFAGALGRQMVSRALGVFISSGRESEVEAIASKVEKNYFNTPEFLEFSIARAQGARSLNEISRFDVFEKIARSLKKNGVWESHTSLSSDDETRRKKLVASLSEEATAHFYSEGNKSSVREDYLSCAEMADIRLNEYIIGEQRGAILLMQARCLYGIGDFAQSVQRGKQSLSYVTSEDNMVAAYAIVVEASREEFILTRDEKGQLLQSYQSAVDALMAAFPRSEVAQASLFELSLHLEKADLYSEARKRLERLLATFLEPLSTSQQDLRTKVIVALSQINTKERNPETAARAQSRLERFARATTLPDEAERVVTAGNAAAVRGYASALRRDGKLEEAALVLETWSEKFSANPLAPEVKLDSVRALAELQDWNNVTRVAESFERSFADNPLHFEMLFWKAKAFEAQLSFYKAALAYEGSSMDVRSPLTRQQKYVALTKAQGIFEELDEKGKSAKTLMRLASLDDRVGPGSARLMLRAAEQFREGGLLDAARNALNTLERADADVEIKVAIQLEKAQLSLLNASTKQLGRRLLDAVCEKVASTSNPSDYSLNLVRVATKVANRLDDDDFEYFYKNISYDERIVLKDLQSLIQRVATRAKILEKVGVKDQTLQSTYEALVNMQINLGVVYKKLAVIAERQSPSLQENFSKRSDDLLSLSRASALKGLELMPIGSPERARYLARLPKLSSIDVLPEPVVDIALPGLTTTARTLRNTYLSPWGVQE